MLCKNAFKYRANDAHWTQIGCIRVAQARDMAKCLYDEIGILQSDIERGIATSFITKASYYNKRKC